MKDEKAGEGDQDFEMVKAATEALSEHFDAVQIIVCRYAGGEGTRHCNYGMGNYFMRKALMEEWLVKEDEEVRERVRARIRKEASEQQS